jgi:hypothetical protein
LGWLLLLWGAHTSRQGAHHVDLQQRTLQQQPHSPPAHP